jgi:hypothetical protein
MKTDKSASKPGTVKTGPRQHTQPQPKPGQSQTAAGKPASGYKAPGSAK